jgi:hypothetical protein
VVIGTHGRLKNWVSKRLLDVSTVAILVFDEADEMLKADAFADDSGELPAAVCWGGCLGTGHAWQALSPQQHNLLTTGVVAAPR